MKKWQKVLILILSFNLLFFSVDSQRKEANASVGAMSLGAYVAGGISGAALAPVLVGLAGALAIGATIKNWDTISAYGTAIWNDLTARGIDPNTLVNTETYKVDVTPEMVSSSAKLSTTSHSGVVAVPAPTRTYSMSKRVSGTFGTSLGVFKLLETAEFDNVYDAAKVRIAIRGLIEQSTNPMKIQVGVFRKDTDPLKGMSYSLYSKELIVQPTGIGGWESVNDYVDFSISTGAIRTEGTDYKVVVSAPYLECNVSGLQTTNTNRGAFVDYGGTFAGAPSTEEARREYGTAILQQNPALTFKAETELQNATISKIITEMGTIEEGIGQQAGVLAKIWVAVQGLPAAIQGIPATIDTKLTSMAKTINDSMSNLWVDAGIVWDGLKKDVTAVNTNINTKVVAGMDALAGGIDNVNTRVSTGMDTLARGIDSIKETTLGWAQSLRDGIDSVNAKIATTSATVVDAVTTGAVGIIENVKTIPESITTAMRELVVPADMTPHTVKMTELKTTLTGKFEFVTIPIQNFKTLYAQKKSLYDLSFTLMGVKVYPFPRSFSSVVNVVKPILTGSAVVSTFMTIYRKFSPDEVVGS